MARDEQHREDLLAEATGLVERVSLHLGGEMEETVAGFRRDGSLAIFFGQERVYQFTSLGKLRRAYVGGLLYKAIRGELVAMHRERTADAVQLVSRALDPQAAGAFLMEMRESLGGLQRALALGDYTSPGQVPPEADIIGRLQAWLESHLGSITIAESPRTR